MLIGYAHDCLQFEDEKAFISIFSSLKLRSSWSYDNSDCCLVP